MSHGVPLSDVASVEVVERQVGKEKVGAMLAFGPVGGHAGKGSKQVTDIVVHTKDGQQGNWVAQKRGGAWIRGKLGPVLHDAGIPFHDDLLAGAQVQNQTSTPAADPAEQLKKLVDLHQSGLITDEEFEAKRAAVIDKL